MKTRGEILITLGVIAAGAGLIGIRNAHRPVLEHACQTYQGYTDTIPATGRVYIFDYQTRGERGTRRAQHRLSGSSLLGNNILSGTSIGQRFCFDYTKPQSDTTITGELRAIRHSIPQNFSN